MQTASRLFPRTVGDCGPNDAAIIVDCLGCNGDRIEILFTASGGLAHEFSGPNRVAQHGDDLGRKVVGIAAVMQQPVDAVTDDLRDPPNAPATIGQPNAMDSATAMPKTSSREQATVTIASRRR